MKNITCVLMMLFLSPNLSFAQKEISIEKGANEKYTYQEVHECPGVSAEIMLRRLENWSRLKFEFYNALEDAETLDLKGFILKRRIAGGMHYTLVVEAKDGKYRTTVNDLLVTLEDGSLFPIEKTPIGKNLIINRIKKDLKTLLPDLDAFLKDQSQLNNSDW